MDQRDILKLKNTMKEIKKLQYIASTEKESVNSKIGHLKMSSQKRKKENYKE
jgi:hypothetical protein